MTATRPRYILDTNVLLHDANALLAFPKGDVIVPMAVIEEVDSFKSEVTEVGRNARVVSKMIDEYRQAGNLSKGLTQPNGSRLTVLTFPGVPEGFPQELDLRRASNRVLATALTLHTKGPNHVVLVSQDTNLRIKANALGVPAMAYEGDSDTSHELYSGWLELIVPNAEFAQHPPKLSPDRLPGQSEAPYPNMGLVVVPEAEKGNAKPSQYQVYRFSGKEGVFVASPSFEGGVWDIIPRNPQQALALDLLLDPKVSIVTLMGKAGTGKTLIALAAGLRLMLEDDLYKKLLVSRPIFPMGKDIGYLPGTAQEKLEPWMQPIFDNLEFLIRSPISRHNSVKGYQSLIDQGMINIEPLTYIRGRSIPQQFMIVDEAQNLTPHEIKTIITRVGEGTKIIFTGDPYQIDNPYVDAVSNGLSHVVERFRPQMLAGHVTLQRGERSPLAEMAANLL